MFLRCGHIDVLKNDVLCFYGLGTAIHGAVAPYRLAVINRLGTACPAIYTCCLTFGTYIYAAKH